MFKNGIRVRASSPKGTVPLTILRWEEMDPRRFLLKEKILLKACYPFLGGLLPPPMHQARKRGHLLKCPRKEGKPGGASIPSSSCQINKHVAGFKLATNDTNVFRQN